MQITHTQYDGPTLELFAAAGQAAQAIPPAWALAQTVAVNPYLGQVDMDLPHVAALMAQVAGAPVTQSRAQMLAQIDAGAVLPEDIEAARALDPAGLPDTVQEIITALRSPAPVPVAVPTIADLARDVSGIDWPALVSERMGHWAAGHFDAGQALWPAPQRTLLISWLAFARRDLTPEIAGLTGFCGRVAGLPNDRAGALAQETTVIGLTPAAAARYFHRLLTTLGGWAQIARKSGWQAEQAGGRDTDLKELLTARLVWEAALWEAYGDKIGTGWAEAMVTYAAPLTPTTDQRLDCMMQRAVEIAGERRLAQAFAAPAPAARAPDQRPAVQAAFCIDVRSEVFRRALEAQSDSIQTVGFAGFFGLAVDYAPEASDQDEARAPVLLTPGLTGTHGATADDDRAKRLSARATRAWGRFRQAAVSSLAFVEAAGPLYLPKLLKDTFRAGSGADVKGAAPRLSPDLSLEDKVGAATKIMAAMSLSAPYARLIVIAGHGAKVTNTPFESALHCGACGGFSGEVNARLLAGLMNDAEVRAQMDIPADTLFVAALHNTTSDAVTLYAEDHPSADHATDLAQLAVWLADAGVQSRTERALSLPGARGADLTRRGQDWSQTRPEWGLAGCTALIAAPRSMTRGRDLGGRTFLHSYVAKADTDLGVLELILTAPVVVASWISLQYYGSTVAPDLFGAGNKLLHNITGGIGVVEGNGGRLRTGLPWQSVHDGDTLRHAAERLSVIIAADTADIDTILSRHAGVAALFDNGWLHLLTLDTTGQIAQRYLGHGRWQMAQAGQGSPAIAAE
jgi:uncharacterized protein YbcC (UPF0753/DUF2309 family)